MGTVSITALEDEWLRKATSAAVASARKVVTDGALPSGTPVGRLSDVEWGWITTAILFGWIGTRAEQATSFCIDAELTVRATGQDPDPWDAGAVATILPDLAQSVKVDWSNSRSMTGRARPWSSFCSLLSRSSVKRWSQGTLDVQ